MGSDKPSIVKRSCSEIPSALWNLLPHPPHPFPLVTTLGSATAALIFSTQDAGCEGGNGTASGLQRTPSGAVTAHHISMRAWKAA